MTAAPKELEPEVEVAKPAPVPAEPEEDTWDASSDEGKDAKEEEDAKDDWDASSGDEKKAAAKPAPKEAKPAPKGENLNLFFDYVLMIY